MALFSSSSLGFLRRGTGRLLATASRWCNQEDVDGAAAQPVNPAAKPRAVDKALPDSEAMLAAVLDALPVGVIIADTNGRIVRDNPANREIWGIPPETIDWEGYSNWIGFWPETGERIQAHEWAMARALVQGAVVRDELIQCQPFGSGDRRYYLNNAAPIRDEAGWVVGGVVAELDVTDRRVAEMKLAESEARLRMATDNAHVGLVVVGEDRRYRFANPAYADILRLPSADIVGLRVADVLAPVYETQIGPRLAQAFAGQRITYELTIPGAAGEQDSFYAVTYEPGRTGTGEPVVVVVLADITERVQANRALADSEVRLRDLLDTVNLGVFMTREAGGRIRFWSEGCTRIYGWTAEEAVGQISHDLLRTRFPMALAEIEAAVERDGGWSGDVRHLARDGRELVMAMRLVVRQTSDPDAPILLEALTDVTAQRQAEAALAALNINLEERVRDAVAACEAAQATARRALHMQAVGQLAGGVAHEFNNILQAVQGGVGIIESRAADSVTVRKFSRIVLGASERGAMITSRLLAFAKQVRFESEAVEPAPILSDLGEVFAHTLGRDVLVRIEHQPVLPLIVVDRAQLETALVNLATNARDAMPDGGTLTLAAAAEVVNDHSQFDIPPGLYVRISVSDNGSGMDRATLARAAEPFFTTKAPGVGTGLGLSMATGFAEQSGGALFIESEPGQGTVVALLLPAAEQSAMMDGMGPDVSPGAVSNRRILIVDDEEMVRQTLAFGLEDAGFAVETAEGGAEALELLRAGRVPDAVVSDFSMPGMDGVALIREIQGLCPRLPAALLTGYAPTDARIAAAGVLANDVPIWRKPVSIRQLVTDVEALLATAG